MRGVPQAARYEPRVVWDVALLNPAAGYTAQDFRFKRNNFRNGEPWSWYLTHMLIAPVSLPYRWGSTNTMSNASTLMYASVRYRHPQRYSYGRRRFWTYAFSPEPSALPPDNQVANLRSSGPFGVARWEFDRPVRVMPVGSPNVRLSGFRRPLGSSALAVPQCTVLFQQLGPVAGRVSSTKPGVFQLMNGITPAVVGATDVAFSLAADAGTKAAPTVFGSRDFARGYGHTGGVGMNPRDNQPSFLTSMSIHIDQRDLDDSVVNGAGTSPLINMAGMAAKLVQSEESGASGRSWWRGFCPMSLIFPTLNDVAAVHRLPRPIILERGDAIEVEARLGDNGITDQILGVSFVGYARIPVEA